jgi:cytochrome c oxidase subunit II
MKLRWILLLSVPMTLFSIPPFVLPSRAQAVTPRRIKITAKRFTFTPGDITLKKGEPVVIVLKSEDVAHGLGFKELGVNIKAAKGQTTEFPFTPDKVGDFVGHCSVFCGTGHGSMTLKLHVVE